MSRRFLQTACIDSLTWWSTTQSAGPVSSRHFFETSLNACWSKILRQGCRGLHCSTMSTSKISYKVLDRAHEMCSVAVEKWLVYSWAVVMQWDLLCIQLVTILMYPVLRVSDQRMWMGSCWTQTQLWKMTCHVVLYVQCLKQTNSCQVHSLRLQLRHWSLRKRNRPKNAPSRRVSLNCANVVRNWRHLLTR